MDTWALVAIGAGSGVLLSPLIVALVRAVADWAVNLAKYITSETTGRGGNGETKG